MKPEEIKEATLTVGGMVIAKTSPDTLVRYCRRSMTSDPGWR